MFKNEDWPEKIEKERVQKMSEAAMRYEEVLRRLHGEIKDSPKDTPGFLTMKEERGGAEGYGERDIWRRLQSEGKLTDVDVGFVIAFESLAIQMAELKIRIKQLESKSV